MRASAALAVVAVAVAGCRGEVGGIVASTISAANGGSPNDRGSGSSGASGDASGSLAGPAGGGGGGAGGFGGSGAPSGGSSGASADGGSSGAPSTCVPKPGAAPLAIDCQLPPLVGKRFPARDAIAHFQWQSGIDSIGIDGRQWINPKELDPSTVTDWTWSIAGGPCDDVLPSPTFAVFPRDVAVWSEHLGSVQHGVALDPEKPPIGCEAGPGCGPFPSPGPNTSWVIANGGPVVYPAFAQTGDYAVTGRFTYTDPNTCQRTESQCTLMVKIRAPGLRVELCWPEVGPNASDDDVDLHVARLQSPASGPHGWFATAGAAPNADDCWSGAESGCANLVPSGADPASFGPGWGYPDTPEPSGAGVCHGWGARRFDAAASAPATRPCTNPRLDRNQIDCDPTIVDPDSPEADPAQDGTSTTSFCAPENVSLDAPNAGDRFAIGVHCPHCVGGQNSDPAKQPAHPRVNVYCNGELVLGLGAPGTGDPSPPALLTEGGETGGAFWNAAVVAWTGDPLHPCDVAAMAPHAMPPHDGWHDVADGSPPACVQNGENDVGASVSAQDPPPGSKNAWPWPNGGVEPTDPDGLCPY